MISLKMLAFKYAIKAARFYRLSLRLKNLKSERKYAGYNINGSLVFASKKFNVYQTSEDLFSCTHLF